MRRWTFAAITGVLVCLGGGAASMGVPTTSAVPSPDFVAGCALPFAALQDHHSIDSACTIAGDLTEDGPNQEQNRTKNNFCATGTPASATWNTFKKLQQKTDALPPPFTFGSHDTLPSDRAPIRTGGFYSTTNGDDVHERTLVRTVAFLLHGAYCNTGAGEGVNCGMHGVQTTSIWRSRERNQSRTSATASLLRSRRTFVHLSG